MKKVQGEGTKCLEAGQGAGGLEEVLVEWRKCWGSLRGAGGVEEVLLVRARSGLVEEVQGE